VRGSKKNAGKIYDFLCFSEKNKKKMERYTKLRNSPLPATPPKKTAHMGVLLVPPPETKKILRLSSPGVLHRQLWSWAS
jgi:hypothetical protein